MGCRLAVPFSEVDKCTALTRLLPLATLRDGALKRGTRVSAEHAVTLGDIPASQLHGAPHIPGS